ncbi:TIR-NBS type disease resistance protein [Salix suchowensis]|nr:TIR-NBS type disease resistance protein [Salix suchowensis]
MELEHHQGRGLLQSGGIVASISYITSPRLKLFFPSRPQYTQIPFVRKLQNASDTPRASIELVWILLHKGNILSVVIEYGEKDDEMLEWFYEEEEKDMWVIQNEFEGYMSLKISSPAAHRICGFNIFTAFSAMSEFISNRRVSLEIRNGNKGIVRVFYPSELPLKLAENFEFLWLNHWRFGSDDAEFDNGDSVSVSVFTDDPAVQIKRVDVQILHEEEGDIHSSNEVIESHTCSTEVIPSHSSSGDACVAKAEVASHIFRNYYSTFRISDDKHDSFSCNFEKK